MVYQSYIMQTKFSNNDNKFSRHKSDFYQILIIKF